MGKIYGRPLWIKKIKSDNKYQDYVLDFSVAMILIANQEVAHETRTEK